MRACMRCADQRRAVALTRRRSTLAVAARIDVGIVAVVVDVCCDNVTTAIIDAVVGQYHDADTAAFVVAAVGATAQQRTRRRAVVIDVAFDVVDDDIDDIDIEQRSFARPIVVAITIVAIDIVDVADRRESRASAVADSVVAEVHGDSDLSDLRPFCFSSSSSSLFRFVLLIDLLTVIDIVCVCTLQKTAN